MRTFILCILAGTLMLSCRQHNNGTEKPILIDSAAFKEKNPYAEMDQSPMDMSYYPADFPIVRMNHQDTAGPILRTIYSRPHKKGRAIFGSDANSLCVYGKAWRLGANEATEIEFFVPVTIAGKNFGAGKYVMYCYPYADHWTIVFNSNLYAWGLHIDSTKDIFRTDIPAMEQQPALEDFTIVFTKATYGADMVMAWDNVKAQLPIEFMKR